MGLLQAAAVPTSAIHYRLFTVTQAAVAATVTQASLPVTADSARPRCAGPRAAGPGCRGKPQHSHHHDARQCFKSASRHWRPAGITQPDPPARLPGKSRHASSLRLGPSSELSASASAACRANVTAHAAETGERRLLVRPLHMSSFSLFTHQSCHQDRDWHRLTS